MYSVAVAQISANQGVCGQGKCEYENMENLEKSEKNGEKLIRSGKSQGIFFQPICGA